MIRPGVYPAAVTPFDGRGKIDEESLAKLLAWFENAGCRGAVLAGTNGEGPSLSAVEKRDLIDSAMGLKGKLDLILGIATPSLEEAIWLCRRGADSGAVAVLLMAPGYFREASEEGIGSWLESVMDKSPVPVLIYNFPQRTGVTITASLMGRLSKHSNMAGLKDSSGDEANLDSYRAALSPMQSLFVGNELLLQKALEGGWSGTISGAANSAPHWLCAIVDEWISGAKVSAAEKFKILEPVLEAIRTSPQPATHKGVLQAFGVLQQGGVRLPLQSAPAEYVQAIIKSIEEATGMKPGVSLPR